MSAVLRLVDNTGGGELPPLQAWELFMRGAGPRRADCARRCGDHATAETQRRARSVVAGGLLRFDQRVLSLVGNARRHEHHCSAAVAALAEAIAAAGVGAGPIMKQYVAVLKDPI
jgi:hypothetical protein